MYFLKLTVSLSSSCAGLLLQFDTEYIVEYEPGDYFSGAGISPGGKVGAPRIGLHMVEELVA